MTQLAVFFDGTWNTPSDRTNVYKLYKLLDEIDLSKQEGIYIPGVGTENGGLFESCKHFLGGAFGDGLSENILDGYKWLIQTYQEGNKIFLFGFSRGAYTARSLAGLIRNCGILRKENSKYIDEAYSMYRDAMGPDCDQAKEFRQRFSFDPGIDFIGVWDTVGSLGIPVDGLALPGFKDYYKFHDTKLSKSVKAAYHALAINEFRAPYAPTLWTQQDDPNQGRPGNLPVEQRWFIGAHCNVGGGYAQDELCDLPCRWIQKMAQLAGLKFLADWPVGTDAYETPPRDSYQEFVGEHPELAPVVKRVPRPAGNSDTLFETVDPSVIKRIAEDGAFLNTDPQLKTALTRLPVGAA
jgi:uncharacterized protein (DUF2235 family)